MRRRGGGAADPITGAAGVGGGGAPRGPKTTMRAGDARASARGGSPWARGGLHRWLVMGQRRRTMRRGRQEARPGRGGGERGGGVVARPAQKGAVSAPGAWLFQIQHSESGKTDPIQLVVSIDSSVHDFMTKSESQPDATAAFLHFDVICKNKKFTPPISLLLRTSFEMGHLATQNEQNRASVEKFRSLCKIQEFVQRLYGRFLWKCVFLRKAYFL